MRKSVIVGVALLCLALIFGSVSCGGEEEVTRQLVEVARGDLTITVSGSGNVEVTEEIDLAFGTGGKIDKMYVDEGDKVVKGEVLAELDTDVLELAVTQAEVALTQARLAQRTAERSLESTRDTEDTLELAVLNAEISLVQAQRTLSTGITAVDFKSVEAALRRAEIWYKYVEDRLQEGIDDEDVWLLALDRAQDDLDVAQANYYNTLAGYDSQDIGIKRKQLEAAEMALVQAQKNLDDLAGDIAFTEEQIVSAKQSVKQAEQSLKNTRKNLGEATITAPFAGVITSVHADEGDLVPASTLGSTVIFHLVDLATMELKVELDEIDIPGVSLGQRAIIDVDALPGLQLEGEVIYISSLAREVAGVVLYGVTIGFAVPEESGLKAGMSVEADIVTNERSDVLLVPSRAVKKDSQSNTVIEVMVGEESQERQVVTGISDGFDTEIIDGLDEGEIVVVER